MSRTSRIRAVLAGLSLCATVALQSAPASSETIKVQAGGPLANVRGQVVCTFNFIFTDGSARYVGTAAHCIDPDPNGKSIGQRVRSGSVDETLGRIGSSNEIGSVVVSDGDIDFALVKLDPGVSISPDVRGWGGPSAVASPSETAVGDQVLFTGYGLGPGDTAVSRPRTGVISSDDDQRHMTDIPATYGDSGGPILLKNGKAYGVIGSIGIGALETGPTISYVLGRMAQSGYKLTLVTGTAVRQLPSFSS